MGEKVELEARESHSGDTDQLGRIWLDFIRVPKTLIATSILASAVLLVIIFSSLTIHTPGSYIHLHTMEQKNSLQPHYIDPNGPMELGGTWRCGSYPSQAKALGCIFDIMGFGWTPPECYYENVSKDGLSKGPWKWYLDKNLTIDVPQEYVNSGRIVEVYAARSYHTEQCKWSEVLIQLAENDETMLLPRVLANREYAENCMRSKGLIGNSLEEVMVRTRVVYNSCVKISEADTTVLYYEQ